MTEEKTQDSRELPVDHLATTTSDGHRVYLYPADVAGKFRNWRNVLQAILIVWFLLLPWIRIAGHQAVLLDIPNRRFAIFGLTFWAHDGPMIGFVLGGFAITLALVTAVWGRIWCGWACPQTVFVDGVFRRIERWIEGKPAARKKLDQGPWTPEKVFKKGAKWAAFVAVTLVITHSFLAYFVGTEELLRMVRSSPLENPTSFIVILITSTVILFDFGWFREQFCVIACPYGRLQSVLMDDRSMVVAYDAERGEPRKGSAKAAEVGAMGACVNCYRCVNVCPTGVDIRRGVQMECIACTACIDACDDMMVRLGKPTGLIRYDSFLGLQHKLPKGIRIRTLAYSAILLGIASALTFVIVTRKPVDIVVLRAIDTPYQIVGEELINHFKVDFSNQTFDSLEAKIETLDSRLQLVISQNPIPIEAGRPKRVDFFLKFPKELLKMGHGSAAAKITYTATSGAKAGQQEEVLKELKLVGPLR